MMPNTMKTQEHWAGKILVFFYSHKWLGLSLLAVLTSLSIRGMFYLDVESDTRKFLPQNTAERQASQKIKELYAIDSEMIIAYEADDIGEPRVMDLVQQITEKLQGLTKTAEAPSPLDEVADAELADLYESNLSELAFGDALDRLASGTSLIQDIQSLNTVSIMRLDADGQLEQKELRSLEGLALRQSLQDWGLYEEALYSDNFRYGAIVLQPRLDLSAKEIYELYQKIIAVLESFEGQGLRFFFSGEAVIQSVVGDYILRDLIRLMPLLALIICAILYGYFRRVSALIIILLPVVFALLATIGLMGWLGIKFTFIHASIPVIIMALGNADSIHTLSHFIEQTGASVLQRIRVTQRRLFLPITLTSITTSIGFLSFASSVMLPIRSFGIFCAVGIAFAWFSSVFMAPLLLPLYAPLIKSRSIQKRGSMARLAWSSTQLLLRRPYVTRLLLSLCIVGLALSIPHVPVNNDTITYFHPNSAVVQASQTINRELAGIYSIHVSIQADKSGAVVTEPEVLQYMSGLADYVRQQNPDLVSKTIGLQDFVVQLNKLLNPGSSSSFPSNRQTVVQYLSLFSGNMDSFVSPDVYEARHARVSIYLNDGSKYSIQKVLQDIEQYQAQKQIEGYSQTQSGYSIVVNSLNRLVVFEQIRSIILAITGVFLIVLFSFRSLRLGLLACLPIVLTLLLNFALMALLRIDLNISTALINSLVIGVGIDYSIHLISAYRHNNADKSPTFSALKQVSASILLNAVAVGLGYATLVFSQFRSLGHFGGFSALANIIAAILALLVMPIFLSRKKERFAS